jgi:glycosyltransferase involved in cell wall biosynthesis
MAELQQLAARLGVQDLLDCRPPVPLHEVPAVMSRASVGVFTPHLDVHIDMALSLKVPEFVAMGVPVVAVRTSIMESLFEPGEVLLFEDGDLRAFAECLLRVYRDREAARAMTVRADRFTAAHGWEAEFARYRSLLQRLTGRGLVPAVLHR